MIISKRALAFVDPTAMNFFMRLIAVIVLTLVGVPFSLLNVWSLGLGINAAALGYMALMALVVYAISLQAYYFALRVGRVAVVAPITSTDPLWTAIFAVVLLGAMLSSMTLAGLGITTIGIILIARYMESDLEPLGDVLPPLVGDQSGLPEAGGVRGLEVVMLSLLTAACWGLSPVVVELGIAANGALTTTMLLVSQVFGVLFLGPLLIVRRRPIFTVELTRAQRRRGAALVLGVGVFEAIYEVLLFLLIDHIGSLLMVLILATAPIWSIVGAMVFLKERPARKLLYAAGVVLAGVLLATVDSLV